VRMANNPYTTLGIDKSASTADIKKAYRTLAKALHPDTNKNNPKAAERFAKVTQAYDLLSDSSKRARFDRGEIDGDGNPAFGGFGGGTGGGNPFGGFGGGASGGSPFGGAQGVDMGDILEGLFNRGRSPGGQGKANPFGGGFGAGGPQPKGANVSYRLNIDFVDAALLSPQRITLKDGKTIDLKLSAGVEDGTQMRLGGKGDVGPGGNGDAIVTIQIKPHRFFTRDGDNVRLSLPISLIEAVKGGAVKVPTVDGAVMLNVPPGSSSGKTLRLKGRGFTGKSGTRGDQLVTLMIDIPADNAALNAFVDEWADPRTVREGIAE
jgi:DnaJ-class molecular chaperone